MARLPFPQRVVLVLLLAMVLASPAAPKGPRPFRVEDRQTSFVSALISDLRAQLWRLLSRSWEKAGCILDPHGGCKPDSRGNTSTTVHGDEGCIADPNGGCASGR